MSAMALLGLEAIYALLRPVPHLDSHDPSGEFGDPSHPPLRVAVLGDSSVMAPGVEGPHEIWVSLVCARLATDHHVILESYAVGGSMAHDVLESQVPPAVSFDPDLIFVSVGANDAIKGVPRHKFAANLDRLISELSETGALIVQSGVGELGTIPRLFPPLSHLMSVRGRRFDRVHWQVAERYGTSVVDQRSDDVKVWATDRSLWAPDHFHVSAAGHARWAETVWRTVAPLVGGALGAR
jgi:lysophospholipase L1-like esterase